MAESKLERAARMHGLAAQFRGFAVQTEWPAYRARTLEMAAELDLEACQAGSIPALLARKLMLSACAGENGLRYGHGKSC